MKQQYKSGAVAAVPAAPASPSVGNPTEGDVVGGTPATVIGAYAFYMLFKELETVVEDGGLNPDADILTQVRDALRARYATKTALAAAIAAIDLDPFARKDGAIFTGRARGLTRPAGDNGEDFATTAWVRGRIDALNTAVAPPSGEFRWPFPGSVGLFTLVGGGGNPGVTGGGGAPLGTQRPTGANGGDTTITIKGVTYTVGGGRGGGGSRIGFPQAGSPGGAGGDGGDGGVEHADGLSGSPGAAAATGPAAGGDGGGERRAAGSGGRAPDSGSNWSGAGGGGQGGRGVWRIEGLSLGETIEVVIGAGTGGSFPSPGYAAEPGFVLISPSPS